MSLLSVELRLNQKFSLVSGFPMLYITILLQILSGHILCYK